LKLIESGGAGRLIEIDSEAQLRASMLAFCKRVKELIIKPVVLHVYGC
jgi:hypothetical protein